MAIESLPCSGRVVLVDDQINEALPLITVLSKNGIPVSYFSDDLDQLPCEPLKNIRVLFMDLRLSAGKSSDKNVISTLYALISRLISPDNGPYILILWSKHETDYLQQLNELFDNDLVNVKPFVMLDLEKSKVITADEDGNYVPVENALELIQVRLKEELKKIGIIELFIIWENIVHESAGETILQFSRMFDRDDKWLSNMSLLFKALAASLLGKYCDTATCNQIYNAGFYVFNKTFLDNLEKGIDEWDFSKTSMALPQQNTFDNIAVRAKLNSQLHLQSIKDPEMPGTLFLDKNKERTRFYAKFSTLVYDCLDQEKVWQGLAVKMNLEYNQLFSDGKKKLKKEYKENFNVFKQEIIDNAMSVLLEVSPVCDFAQKKLITHRLLPGLALPQKYFIYLKRADYLYLSPLYMLFNGIYSLVFDLRYMTALPKREFSDLIKEIVPECALRQSILGNIQVSLAKHVGRTGIQTV